MLPSYSNRDSKNAIGQKRGPKRVENLGLPQISLVTLKKKKMLCQRSNPGSRTHSGNWPNTEAAQGIFQMVKADLTSHAQFGLKGTPVGASQLPRCHSAQNCSVSSLLLTFSPDYLADSPLPPSTPTTLQYLCGSVSSRCQPL